MVCLRYIVYDERPVKRQKHQTMTAIQRPSKKVLITYFKGESKPAEKALIELYLALDIDHEFVQQCLQEAWTAKYWQTPQLPANMDHQEVAWQNFLSLKTQNKSKKSRQKVWWYAAAAILLLSFGLGLQWYKQSAIQHTTELAQLNLYKRYEAPLGKLTKLVLADSSTVTMFPGASLDLPKNFNQQNRQVVLKGRAYFEVAHNTKKPFYVSSGQLKTRVLGTSFEVATQKDGQQQKVILHTGKIAVSYAHQTLAVLKTDQQFEINKAGKFNISEVSAEQLTSWTKEQLSYHQVPLNDICTELGQWYGVNIIIKKPAIGDKKLTASFTRKPLNTVMDILSMTGNFHYEINNNTITIY